MNLIITHCRGQSELAKVYNSIVEKHLLRLIEINIDIRELINETEILSIEIKNESYPSLHYNQEKRTYSAETHNSIDEVIKDGNTIINGP